MELEECEICGTCVDKEGDALCSQCKLTDGPEGENGDWMIKDPDDD